MGLGYLKIQAHTGNDALPVSGATVIIKDATGKILHELTTDEVRKYRKSRIICSSQKSYNDT